jgi:hypothetical protein
MMVAISVVGLALTGVVTAATAASGTSAGRTDRGKPFVALLAGTNEVPPASTGDPDGAGFTRLRVDTRGGRVCVKELKVGGVALPLAMFHIHKGAAGVNGPVVVDFSALLPSGVGCVPVADGALLKDISRHPDQYYANVHNAEFTGGAARGQLEQLAGR